MRKNCLGYPVELVEDAFGSSPVLADMIKKATSSSSPRVLIVADQNVVQHTEGLGPKIGGYMTAHGLTLAGAPVILSGGERIKNDNFASVMAVVDAALDAKLGQDACLLALGGGTLLDVAGYAAAQVRGGVRLIRVPTTVAAMTEGAFATYAAVNTMTIKDALRVPSEPAGVLIDPLFAKTVLDGVWRAGIGESVRLAVVSDAAFLRRIAEGAAAFATRDYDTLAGIVSEALAIRLKKGGTPFAEWSAQRLEPLSGYKLPHGYSVGIGVLIDTAYAVAKGLLKAEDRACIVSIFDDADVTEGLSHSRYLLGKPDVVLKGLDAWALTHGPEIVLPKGLGKSVSTADLDRDLYAEAIRTCMDAR